MAYTRQQLLETLHLSNDQIIEIETNGFLDLASKRVVMTALDSYVLDDNPNFVKPKSHTNLAKTPVLKRLPTVSQQRALELILSGNNYFITGAAGTGKSYLLKEMLEPKLRQLGRQYIVTAPTGIAAIHVGGATIHSTFKLKVIDGIQNPDNWKIISDYNQWRTLQLLDVLIIDEISMVSPDVIDVIDKQLKLAKNNEQPFGGVQILLFGDLFQLPPVTPFKMVHGRIPVNIKSRLRKKYGGTYFFNSPPIQKCHLKIIELGEIKRQKDDDFIDDLNSIRDGSFTNKNLESLNRRHMPVLSPGSAMILASKRETVRGINQASLARLDGTSKVFQATIYGFIRDEIEDHMANELLELKVGAKVMIIANLKDQGLVNGHIGTVQIMNDNAVFVKVGKVLHRIERYTWLKNEYYVDDEQRILVHPVGAFTQFPLLLAFAVTIHKSQGQTLKEIVIDPEGAFDYGQIYVALSRAPELSGITLKSKLQRSYIKIHPDVVGFLNDFPRAT